MGSKRKKERQKIIKANNNKKRKKNKDTNMAWWNSDKNKKSGSFIGKWNTTKPTTGTQDSTLSVMLYTQKSLDEIAALCKPKAGGSEFQVHCRGAQIVIKKPEGTSRLVFTIPTYYFNMPQKVSSGSVDFNLDEVSEISNQIAPMSIKMVEAIGESFPTQNFKDLGYDVSFRELEMGSLHRHPGDFGFSGTDLDNQVEKPGVIFRNLKCVDKIQVDSVMYIPGSKVKIVTTETRVVTVAPSEDEGIEGTYETAPTLCYIVPKEGEADINFEEFFGNAHAIEAGEIDFHIDQFQTKESYPEIAGILSKFINGMDYEPQLIVDPELIEQEFIYNRTTTYKGKGTKHYNYYGNDLDYEEYDPYSGYEDPAVTKKNLPASTSDAKDSKKSLTRPTWRKTQALGLLKAKGVDVVNNKNITGDTSNNDVFAIVAALKAIEHNDIAIRAFFTTCAYPTGSLEVYYNELAATSTI